MGQQTAGTARIFVKDVAVVVGADVHALYDQLAVVNVGPGVFQVGSAGTQAFDLGADKLDACFQGFHHKVLVAGLTVQGNHLFAGFFLSHEAHLFSLWRDLKYSASMQKSQAHPVTTHRGPAWRGTGWSRRHIPGWNLPADRKPGGWS